MTKLFEEIVIGGGGNLRFENGLQNSFLYKEYCGKNGANLAMKVTGICHFEWELMDKFSSITFTLHFDLESIQGF